MSRVVRQGTENPVLFLCVTYACVFVSGDSSKGEGGETLTVIDPTEAWVFHVMGDDTGASAIWVAQRVPDNHVRPNKRRRDSQKSDLCVRQQNRLRTTLGFPTVILN